uniref:Uncharacterized protein n=1 Tax=Macaca fascicularis TaxID=9541 RepID=A0A7N9CA40_MACFA
CYKLDYGLFIKRNYHQTITMCLSQKKGSRVHVHNVQFCYICIHVPCWCAAPVNSFTPLSVSFWSV